MTRHYSGEKDSQITKKIWDTRLVDIVWPLVTEEEKGGVCGASTPIDKEYGHKMIDKLQSLITSIKQEEREKVVSEFEKLKIKGKKLTRSMSNFNMIVEGFIKKYQSLTEEDVEERNFLPKAIDPLLDQYPDIGEHKKEEEK